MLVNDHRSLEKRFILHSEIKKTIFSGMGGGGGLECRVEGKGGELRKVGGRKREGERP